MPSAETRRNNAYSGRSQSHCQARPPVKVVFETEKTQRMASALSSKAATGMLNFRGQSERCRWNGVEGAKKFYMSARIFLDVLLYELGSVLCLLLVFVR